MILVVAVVAVVVVVAGAIAVQRLTRGDGDGGVGFGRGPRSEPEEQWRTEIDDDLDTLVVADDERVYVLQQDVDSEPSGEEAAIAIRAFAASDGDELWDAEVGGDLEPGIIMPIGEDQVLLVDRGEDTAVNEDLGESGDDVTRLVDASRGDELWEVGGRLADSYVTIEFFARLPLGASDVFIVEAVDSMVVAVDRETGQELWSEEGDDVLPCGDAVVISTDEDDDSGDDAADFSPSSLTAYDLRSGDERWDAEGQLGLCDSTTVALSTATDELELRRLSDGEEVATLDLPSGDEAWSGFPVGEHIVVQRSTFDDEEIDVEAAAYPASGGEPTWEESNAFAFPIDDDRVLSISSGDGDQDIRLVRLSDGEDIGEATFPSDENDCDGAFTDISVISCETGSGDVEAYDLDTLEERWTIDAGAEVAYVAVGGDQLFLATDGGELLAFG